MERSRSVAREAARAAGDLILAAWQQGRPQAETKATGIDMVTATDRAADALIANHLRAAFPDDELVLEETGRHLGASGSTRRWYVDPLDGTTNFAHGFPQFGVTLALEEEGVVVLGVTLDVTRGHLYEAALGQGATVDGVPLRVSDTSDLGHALLATGFPYDRHTSGDDNTAEAIAFLKRVRGIRRPGAASLDLAYVARGWLDGYWEMRLNPWDVAAGMLLVTEAGGAATNYAGGQMDIQGATYAASNGHLHAAMLAVLAQVRED
jgi:myo-inositol-1(or 4)-monophosphatase